jgi:hypothetical protein
MGKLKTGDHALLQAKKKKREKGKNLREKMEKQKKTKKQNRIKPKLKRQIQSKR